MSERKTVFRMYFPWQDDKEERWLEEMARSGWHLVRFAFVHVFERGNPADVRYRLDYRTQSQSALDEYFHLCQDAGWERVCSFAGWHYFRTASAEAPEIYTDVDSLVAKYRRLLGLAIVFAIATGVQIPHMLRFSEGNLAHRIIERGLLSLEGLIFGLWIYALVRIAIRIRNLRAKVIQT